VKDSATQVSSQKIKISSAAYHHEKEEKRLKERREKRGRKLEFN
jgi:hypothetical protein